MGSFGNVKKVRYDRSAGHLVLSGNVGDLNGEAVMISDSPFAVEFLGKEFAGVLLWYEGVRGPHVSYFDSAAKVDALTRGDIEPKFFRCKITDTNFAHPGDECAPRHKVRLIRQTTRRGAIRYNKRFK